MSNVTVWQSQALGLKTGAAITNAFFQEVHYEGKKKTYTPLGAFPNPEIPNMYSVSIPDAASADVNVSAQGYGNTTFRLANGQDYTIKI